MIRNNITANFTLKNHTSVAIIISSKSTINSFELHGHIIKHLLTELDRTAQENIWPSVTAHGPGAVPVSQ